MSNTKSLILVPHVQVLNESVHFILFFSLTSGFLIGGGKCSMYRALDVFGTVSSDRYEGKVIIPFYR